MNEKGEIQEKVIVEKVAADADKAKAEALVKKCNQKGADNCDTAFKVFECYFQEKAHLV
jgi:hypothetical protein